MKQLPPSRWNRETAAHLLVRSGFGATPEQIDEAAGQPMETVVERVLTPAEDVTPPAWVRSASALKPNMKAMQEDLTDPEKRRLRKLFRQEQQQEQRELTQWWIGRMINSPCPLQEKMALFWHGHFATSIRKVRVPYMMYLQNQTFRELGMGNWRNLITAVSQDPAMLIYLDNTRSMAKSPNENYARELMELFTLGEGHYTEKDIKEAARALTGWRVDNTTYAFSNSVQGPQSKRFHDSGKKTFFGQTGSFDGHDIIRIILEQERAAPFITRKLWAYFADENPDSALVEQLAEQLRMNDYELRPVLKTMFMSEAFYSERTMRQQIKSPVQWLVGSCIALRVEQPDERFCQNALRSLGQELFAPPNVKGWDGGYAWITTSSLTQRYNLASGLIQSRRRPADSMQNGRKKPPPRIVRTEQVLPKTGRTSKKAARDYLEELLYQHHPEEEEAQRLDRYFEALPPVERWTDDQIRNLLHTMMSTPRYQLT